MEKDKKREIILSHYNNPFNKKVSDGYLVGNSNNESCIDNINVYLDINDNKIGDASFDGEACVISISSTSIMIKLLIGKSIDEVKSILVNYSNMINEIDYDKNELFDLLVFDDIYLQPHRKTCAMMCVYAINRILEKL